MVRSHSWPPKVNIYSRHDIMNIEMQLWQKGLCSGLLSSSMLVRLQSAVSIKGMMAESGLKQLLAKESKYLIRLPLVQIQFIPPTYA